MTRQVVDGQGQMFASAASSASPTRMQGEGATHQLIRSTTDTGVSVGQSMALLAAAAAAQAVAQSEQTPAGAQPQCAPTGTHSVLHTPAAGGHTAPASLGDTIMVQNFMLQAAAQALALAQAEAQTASYSNPQPPPLGYGSLAPADQQRLFAAAIGASSRPMVMPPPPAARGEIGGGFGTVQAGAQGGLNRLNPAMFWGVAGGGGRGRGEGAGARTVLSQGGTSIGVDAPRDTLDPGLQVTHLRDGVAAAGPGGSVGLPLESQPSLVGSSKHGPNHEGEGGSMPSSAMSMECTWPGCNKRLKTRDSLRAHQRTHSGQRP
jgi:hypothetical protein